MAMVASSCTTSTEPDGPDQALVARISSYCGNLDAPELGPGYLCVDNGFRLDSDDFAFSNWGRSTEADANVTIQTFIDLFGRSNVCAPGPDNECVLRPATIQKLEEWNTALSGGRCEGLATLSARMFMRLDHPSMFRDGATTVADLRKGDGSLDAAIVYWWSTQFLPEVADRAAASRARTPLQLVDDLIVGLANSVGHTIGMYSGNSGHSVTPFAVTKRDDSFVVHVYDNNFPGERREIVVDATSDRWRYEAATTAIDGTKLDWTGGAGTLELTPMSARKGPFRCPFCTIEDQQGQTTVTLASRDPASPGYVRIASRRGVIEATTDSVTNTIEGATYMVSKGRTGGLVTVSLPSDIGDFDIAVRRGTDKVPAADVVVGVQRAGMPAVQVTGDLARGTIGDTGSARPVVDVRSSGITVRAPSENQVRVSVAAGSTISRRSLQAGETMTVANIDDDTIEVSLKGSNGYEHGRREIAVGDDIGTREATVTIDQDGSIVVNTRTLAAVPVSVSAPVNFTPGALPTPTTTVPPARSTTTTVPSIEISDPD